MHPRADTRGVEELRQEAVGRSRALGRVRKYLPPPAAPITPQERGERIHAQVRKSFIFYNFQMFSIILLREGHGLAKSPSVKCSYVEGSCYTFDMEQVLILSRCLSMTVCIAGIKKNTLKGKSAEAWRVSGWRKYKRLVEMKR